MENRPPLENATETPEVSPNDRVLSVRDASQVSGLPTHVLRRLESAGDLESFRIGRAVFISERSLKALLDRARGTAHKAQPLSSVSTGGAL